MHTLSGLQINNRIGYGYYVHSATAHTLAFTGVGSLGSLISNPPKIPFFIPPDFNSRTPFTGPDAKSLSEARFLSSVLLVTFLFQLTSMAEGDH